MSEDPLLPLGRLTDAELLARLRELARGQARLTAVLVAHLAELDSRRLYLAEGFPSLYAYCRHTLKLSEHAAYDRIAAARVVRRFPAVLRLLSSGSLHLAAVGILGRHLTAENHQSVLRWAEGRSKREMQLMAARLVAGPVSVTSDSPDAAGANPLSASSHTSGLDLIAAPDDRPTAAIRPGHRRSRVRIRVRTTSGQPVARPRGRPRTCPPGAPESKGAGLTLFAPVEPHPAVNPTSANGGLVHTESEAGSAAPAPSSSIVEYRLTVGLDPEEWAALETARRLLRPRFPDGEIGRVVGHVLRAFVAGRLARRRGGKVARRRVEADAPEGRAAAGPPAKVRDTPEAVMPATQPPAKRYIPAAVRRAVWDRDGGRCGFVSAASRRCEETLRLEFHHRVSFREGGAATVHNLELRCRAHNLLEEIGEPSAWRGRTGDSDG